jgi:opacity protein-like surface antigen
MKTLRSLVVRAALACGAALALVSSSFAADAYATPEGAGDRNGSSWAHAYDQSQIQSAANALTPGDTLYLGSGTYESVSLTLTSSGEPSLPKSIVG